jgi:hypothetical protein
VESVFLNISKTYIFKKIKSSPCGRHNDIYVLANIRSEPGDNITIEYLFLRSLCPKWGACTLRVPMTPSGIARTVRKRYAVIRTTFNLWFSLQRELTSGKQKGAAGYDNPCICQSSVLPFYIILRLRKPVVRQ